MLIALACASCTFGRLLYFNTPTLAAPSYFERRVVRASPAPNAIAKAPREARFELSSLERKSFGSFDQFLKQKATRAFIAIHDDTIVYERYFGGVTAHSELPGFSMSKTFAAALVGRALCDGVLPSLDAPVTAFVPELAGKKRYRDVTLERLLRMTSGIDFDEESIAGASLYYTTDLRDLIYSYDVKWPPGEHYLYGSVNIELLWDVLNRRLGGETVSHYFEREIWQPLGAEHAASWSLDSAESGAEKFFGGFNATARDQARLGLLFLHAGSLNGKSILPEAWVTRSVTPDPVAGLVHTTDGWVRRGMYQWFLTRDGRAYFAKGYNGQYVFVVPARHWVFVRFGEGYGGVDWPGLFLRLTESAG
ncbi:MAG TPA: serine hydrolase [Polyangiaceae bacterium]|nr:serine hydrolase [Polyangiaceae bacterium]